MMEAMEKEKVQLNTDCKDFETVQEMLSGCNAAIVNFALTDNMKLIRSVTFFNVQDHDMESISASCNYLSQSQGDISLSKNVMYRIFSFNKIKKAGIGFWSMLWKSIPGFKPDEFCYDCRKQKV